MDVLVFQRVSFLHAHMNIHREMQGCANREVCIQWNERI